MHLNSWLGIRKVGRCLIIPVQRATSTTGLKTNDFRSETLSRFVYDSNQDSVVQVTKEGYDNCTATLTTLSEYCPVATVKDGHTTVKLNKSGPHYFISGKTDHCQKNEKLVVVVLADRSRAPAASPPSPGVSGMVPAPTPSNEESPPPGPVEIIPTPAPTTTVPSNSASSMFASFIGSMGAFLASSLILAI
ncbi:hypothetical protein OIU76_025645 [Salix suchowensis]|uniref:Phytocyanin domain-containing protein n=1 Tax=Salix suchowensis TaxID=1278906 RepID=A0ABQ9AC54_9ROSI|nr:hypothetical protein OIU77_008786 [Salix suchowensis]KAJ6376534.1 hypothetical protein OIU76_025645 [Salix suchowensis]